MSKACILSRFQESCHRLLSDKYMSKWFEIQSPKRLAGVNDRMDMFDAQYKMETSEDDAQRHHDKKSALARPLPHICA